MSSLIKYILILCFFLVAVNCIAQQCEWLDVQGSSGPRDDWVSDIAVDKNNNIIVCGAYPAPFYIGTYHLKHSGTSVTGFQPLIVKYNTDGKVVWVDTTITIQNSSVGSFTFTNVITDYEDNIYGVLLVGNASNEKINFGSNVKIDSLSGGATVLVKYNKNGVVQWAEKIQNAGTGFPIKFLTKDKLNNIYIGLVSSNSKFNNVPTILNHSGGDDIYILKYSSSGKPLTAINIGGSSNEVINDLESDEQGNLYLLCRSGGGFNLGNKNYNAGKEIILKLTPSLAHINGIEIVLNKSKGLTGIGVEENGNFAVVGTFHDSVNFGNGVFLKSQWSGFPNHSGTNFFFRDIENGIVYYDSTFKPLWARKSNSISNSSNLEPIAGVAIGNNNIYFGGFIRRGTVSFGSSIINVSGTNNTQQFYFVKMDTLGNFLWAFANDDSTSNGTMKASEINGDGDVAICGNFKKNIKIFNKSKQGLIIPYSDDFFVAKISDFSITRGYVKSGPYCAGDTIKIPYTKKGTYKEDNEFIAELSDSAGNFNGGERELGRIKDTTGGIIKGVLPLFNVATSGKYRIRILSTNPTVQSYYKRDTLRLLIYSKDTANAGANQTICYGQEINLSTTGGSKWEWSPTSSMPNKVDSSNRQPLVKPLTDTEYRIIISDSSGCGEIDTDYVKIMVRQPLSVSLSDTLKICKGRQAFLKAQPIGGDSTQYRYRWLLEGDSLNTIIGSTQQLTVSPINNTTYIVILNDSCTPNEDTAWVTVIPDSTLLFSPIADTTLCLGNTLTIDAHAIACDAKALNYTWDNIGTGAKKTLSPTQTTTYSITAQDTINKTSDTIQFTITVRDPLSLTINQDSTICISEQAELRAIATGGRTSTHNIQWYVTNNLITNNPITQVTPTTTTTYKAILSDGCTIENDSSEITITVRPKLEVTVNPDTTICIGKQAQLRATPKGGYTPQRQLQWIANNQQQSTNNTLAVNPTTTTIYKAILSDGCTTPNDSATITVNVRPKLTLTLNIDTTICIGEQAELRAIPSGGYTPQHQIQWIANNQQLSTNNIIQVSPTQTTTYKSILSDGCTTPSDSNELTITVRPPLQLTTQVQDSICSNEILLLTAIPTGGLANNHNIQWSTNNSTWTTNQNPATYTPQISTTYIATLTDNCSPPVQDTLQVIVLPIPIANFTVNPTFGCPPLTITLTDNSLNNDSSQNTWTIDNTEYQGRATQTHELLKQGTYSIKLNVKNQLGCSDEKTEANSITVFEKPQADFIIKPDIKEVEEPLQLYNLSRNFTQAIWQMGDGNQLTTPKDTSYKYHEDDTGNRQVQLIAINNQGCRDTAGKLIRLFDKVNCTIPTAFTPNGDGLNNTFKPVCVGVANYTLTIYNRWGQVIYQQQNGAWDGNYIDQPVPMGVYMYKIQINAQSQKKKLTYGTVQLIR